jgi:hypothetical protein
MKFTFDKWKKIRHGLKTAMKSFEDELKDGNPSEDPLSMYQIFRRQVQEMTVFIERIDNAVL